MKNLWTIILILSAFSCSPYQLYHFTYYHMTAAYDPASTELSANVQIVFVPQQEYHDSICFRLNESVEIQSLTAQELKYYEFDSGRLVLYIEEAVMPGDQLHISLTYQGTIGFGPEGDTILTPDRLWYPVNPGIKKLTYSMEFDLPEQYGLEYPGIQKGQYWHLDTDEPLGAIVLPLKKE